MHEAISGADAWNRVLSDEEIRAVASVGLDIEHHYGEIGGREAIYTWIQSTMEEWPNNEMIHFPIDWYSIDDEKGWVICRVWNRFADPGDGSIHQEANITILKYAGNGQWKYEEDVYNPAHFATMVKGYLKRKKELETAPALDGS